MIVFHSFALHISHSSTKIMILQLGGSQIKLKSRIGKELLW